MKKRYIHIIIASLMVMIMCSLTGCNNISDILGVHDEEHSRDEEVNNGVPEGETRIYDIKLVVASPNEDHTYCVNYPNCYYVFGPTNVEVKLNKEYETKYYVKDEDLQYLLKFISEHEDYSYRTEESPFTYSLTVCYFDENDEMVFRKAWGYDTFPAELNDVIDKMNEMCGEDVMSYPTDVITDIPEFIYSETGLTENDYPKEDIEKMWEDQNFIAMDKMLSEYYSISGMMNIYYTSLKYEDIADYAPTTLREAKSISDDEFEQFVDDYLKVLNDEMGESWMVTQNNIIPDRLNMINRDDHPMDGCMYIAKAEALDNCDVYLDGDEYVIIVPDGELQQRCNFVYNEDASCILVGYDTAGGDFNEYVKKFVSL